MGPTGQWVRAHADSHDMDMIVFVTGTPGRYQVRDPLNPQLSTEFAVF